jgi:hypothetical protein
MVIMIDQNKLRKTIMMLFLLWSGLLTAQSNLTGKYVSNFAEGGFFITEIQLNSNQTFIYKFSGPNNSDTTSGTYELENSILKLNFNANTTGKDSVYIHSSPAESITLNRPAGFYFKNDKLWRLNSKGSRIKKSYGKFECRSFGFFGKKSSVIAKSKFYLKRSDN